MKMLTTTQLVTRNNLRRRLAELNAKPVLCTSLLTARNNIIRRLRELEG